jgi:hypothetical protein
MELNRNPRQQQQQQQQQQPEQLGEEALCPSTIVAHCAVVCPWTHSTRAFSYRTTLPGGVQWYP